MKEIICDTNIFYRYKSMYRSSKKNYLPNYYNLEDLVASGNNISNIDNRLKNTIKSKLKYINNHSVLIFEPHFYIIKDIFPNANFGKLLFQRIDKTNPKSLINTLSEIILDGSDVTPEIKTSIQDHSEKSNERKKVNNAEIMDFAKKTFVEIGYKNKHEVNFIDFIPYVEKLLISQLNIYREKYMIHTSVIDSTNFDVSQYELFIKTYARYLAVIVGPEGLNPAYNDNIDSLILLYVKKGRKFMSCDNKWLQYIKNVGLHKVYIEPYSKSYFKHLCNKLSLWFYGKIEFKDCD